MRTPKLRDLSRKPTRSSTMGNLIRSLCGLRQGRNLSSKILISSNKSYCLDTLGTARQIALQGSSTCMVSTRVERTQQKVSSVTQTFKRIGRIYCYKSIGSHAHPHHTQKLPSRKPHLQTNQLQTPKTNPATRTLLKPLKNKIEIRKKKMRQKNVYSLTLTSTSPSTRYLSVALSLMTCRKGTLITSVLRKIWKLMMKEANNPLLKKLLACQCSSILSMERNRNDKNTVQIWMYFYFMLTLFSRIIILFIMTDLENSYFNTINKDKYSFSKSPRFPDLKPQYTIDFFETNKSNWRKKGASFGYGSKFDFFKQRERSPEPSKYYLGSTNVNHAASLGKGRDEVKSNSYINPEILKYPSVGCYQIPLITKKGPTFKIAEKHENLDSFVYVKKDKKGFPDPGKYDPKDTTYSRHKSQMVCKFGSAKRFKYEVSFDKTVGPGQYSKDLPLKTKHGSFSHSKRKTYVDQSIAKNITPGFVYNVK